jgi:tRNA-splicing endonuclease subunit Sen2
VSEQRTALRREERRQVKWERARTEQEALERTRLEEALLASGSSPSVDDAIKENVSTEQAAEKQTSIESEPVASGPLDEPSTSQVSHDSLDDLSITVASRVFGYANKMADFEPEIDLDAMPDFPSPEQAAQDSLSPILEDFPVVPTSATEDADVQPGPSEPLEDLTGFRAPVGPMELLSLPNASTSLGLGLAPVSAIQVPVSIPAVDIFHPALPTAETGADIHLGPSSSNVVPEDDEPLEPNVRHKAPVGPLELLALPDSLANIVSKATTALETVRSDMGHVLEKGIESTSPFAEDVLDDQSSRNLEYKAPVGPLELLALPNSLAILHLQTKPSSLLTGATLDNIETITESTAVEVAVAEAVTSGLSISKSPVGPLELLALPNSLAMVRESSAASAQLDGLVVERVVALTEVAQPGSEPSTKPEASAGSDVASSESGAEADIAFGTVGGTAHANGHVNGSAAPSKTNGSASAKSEQTTGVLLGDIRESEQPHTPMKRTHSEVGGLSVKRRKGSNDEQCPDAPLTPKPPVSRRKSVRFSTTVESTTFRRPDSSSPPRPNSSANLDGTEPEVDAVVVTEAVSPAAPDIQAPQPGVPRSVEVYVPEEEETVEIENKEHLQLSPEEAFFLSFGLGALSVLDPVTQKPISLQNLLALFRSHSYFPPNQDLQPDDPFLVHYAVYHHFRSLGWVPRHGIKFGVDWMIYQRGPVFDHAEFGAMVMSAYSDPWWREQGKQPPKKSWHWLHGVNRVLSHVLKSLVLVYVDVPTPAVFDEAMNKGGIAAALKTYNVREFMVRRWSSNRNR